MVCWFETIGIVAISVLGIVLGRFFSKAKKSSWLYAYLFSLLLILIFVATRYSNSPYLISPFLWLTAGRIKFVVLSLAITVGFSALEPRMPHKFEKPVVFVMMILFVSCFCIVPFLAPAIFKKDLSDIKTTFAADGVCLQSKRYTCGPAAAVTALGKLGLKADEGKIAVLSRTSPITGTLPNCLSTALENLYSAKGLKCTYRYFDSLEQLKNAGITLAVLKDTFISDHCVAVLEVSENLVRIADPEFGMQLIPHKQFEQMWRNSGIVLTRELTQSI